MYDRIPMMPSRFTPFIATGLCCLHLFAVHSLPSAGAQGAASIELKYELRTYEVGDLVLNIQDHPYSESLQKRPAMFSGGGGGGMGGGASGGGFGGGGGGVVMHTSSLPGSAKITMDDLVDVITTTVVQDSWAENGTGKGQIMSLGTALVVWQSQEVHDHIEDLLIQVRQGSADRRTLTVDARWLLLNSDELKGLILPDQEGVPQVNREVLEDVTRRPGSIRGMTNCFSGQLVYLISGTRRNVVSSYIPVVGSIELPDEDERFASRRGKSMIRFVSDSSTGGHTNAPKVGYQPIIEKPNLGTLLEIRPTLIPSEPAAVVDVISTITVSSERPTDLGARTHANSIAPEVDRIAIETQQFATTLRLPLGKPILVGGLTHVPGSMAATVGKRQGPAGQGGGATEESPQLYFVLEVR